MYSPAINKLIEELRRLPTVGQHTAERFVFHWLKSGKKEVGQLALGLKNLMEKIKSCGQCWNFAETNPCFICAEKTRDQRMICVVGNVPNLAAIEQTRQFRGVYHVLRGVLDASEPESLLETKIPELRARVEKLVAAAPQQPLEIILALNPDMPGETTMLYLEQQLKAQFPGCRITRLARGLPMGSDISYADEITLGSALKGRTER